jgi:hypothetical protein
MGAINDFLPAVPGAMSMRPGRDHDEPEPVTQPRQAGRESRVQTPIGKKGRSLGSVTHRPAGLWALAKTRARSDATRRDAKAEHSPPAGRGLQLED